MWGDLQANATAPFDFSGKNNYSQFISLAGDAGMHVVARLGPYVCGERSMGAVPLWMRSEAACFRCSDPGWESHMAAALVAYVNHISHLLAPLGGPIIALQVENEYNGPDLPYLEWAVATARNLTTAVPWMLCHDLVLCRCSREGGGLDRSAF
jgi:beta-galactosidase GanA